jgi:hypothetical protein
MNYEREDKKKKNSDIMLNSIVVYTDNRQESFEALRVINRGVIIGRIIDGDFFDCGFISKRNIKEIKNGI